MLEMADADEVQELTVADPLSQVPSFSLSGDVQAPCDSTQPGSQESKIFSENDLLLEKPNV